MTTSRSGTAPSPAISTDHLSVRAEGMGPAEVHFQFEQQQKRMGGAVGLSMVVHAVLIALFLLAGYLLPERTYEAILPDRLPDSIVWLAEPGPGGGGGGGGAKTPEPPKKAEVKGVEKISVPAVREPEPIPTPEPPKPEPPQLEQLINIPVLTTAAAVETAPGVPNAGSEVGNAGTGPGTGAGSGTGSGLGPGIGGGTGGDVYQPGSGIELPRVRREVKPQYTAEAMRAKVQGAVILQCIVNKDGTVGDVEVVKSLDPTFGLDQEAIKAAKQWSFIPGRRQGEPVAVRITIELTFTLR